MFIFFKKYRKNLGILENIKIKILEMPQANFKGVFAVSSEDPSFPASSLLKIDAGKKWRCKETGLQSAFVILQLEKSSQITGIDIGNEHSAFVEVLVGKNGFKDDDFKEILMTCSFMSPPESKSSQNPNRVRCFSKSGLVESVSSEKWDLVKVLCTQPFNKHVQYGISFIKLHITEDEKPKVKKSLVPEKFLPQKPKETAEGHAKLFAGKFKIREDSPDSESESSMGLFNRWKQRKTSSEVSTAVSIREASKKPDLVRESLTPKPKKLVPSCSSKTRSPENDEDEEGKEKPKVLDRNRMDLLFGEEDDKPNEKFEKKLQKDKERREKELEESSKGSKRLSTSAIDNKSTKKMKLDEDVPKTPKDSDKDRKRHESTPGSSRKESSTPGTSKAKKNESTPGTSKTDRKEKSKSPHKRMKVDENYNQKDIVYKPFLKLLEGVTIVISGIQNPDRANLRTMALAMGAKYKADWDSSCTHLICAFKNTPKYNQVRKVGKIVKRHWVEKCHQLKKRIPWRRYALDDREAEKPESEDEILDESSKPSSKEEDALQDKTMALYDQETSNHGNSSEEDTEDELEKVRAKNKPSDTSIVLSDDDQKTDFFKKKTPTKISYISSDEEDKKPVNKKTPKKPAPKDDFDATTDEEEFTIARKGVFGGKKVYLSSVLGAVDRMKLEELLKEHKAIICDKDSGPNFVICSENEKPSKKTSGEYVTPKWVYESCDLKKLLPTNRYLV